MSAEKKPTHTPRYTFRLPTETIERIDAISAQHHGLSRTAVLIAAVDRLHAADVGPPKKSRRKSEAPS